MTRVRGFFAAAAAAPLLFGACTDWAGYDLDYAYDPIPALATMRTSVGFDPYEMPRLPPEHSVPVAGDLGPAPGPFGQAQLDSVAATLANPFAGGADPQVLARGEALYAAQCSVCHGPTGAGNGPIIGGGKFPFSLPVNAGAAVARSDGYLYAIIAAGRGLMPPYGEKLAHADRWAVVAYVRELQRAGGAAPAPAVVAPAAAAAPVAAPGQGVAAPAGAAGGQPAGAGPDTAPAPGL